MPSLLYLILSLTLSFYLNSAIPGGLIGKPSCSLIPYISFNIFGNVFSGTNIIVKPRQGYYWENNNHTCVKVNIPPLALQTSNLYNTTQECEQSCKDAKTLLKDQNYNPRLECNNQPILQPNPKIMCFAAVEGWTFDNHTRTCKSISYGCGDTISNNLFRTEQICMDTCNFDV